MSDAENELIDTARKISNDYADHFPEGVLFGFAKLADMDYNALEVLLSDASVRLMEGVRDFFKEQSIDIKLFKQYFPILASAAMDSKERKEKLKDFFDSLKEYRVNPILDMSVRHSVIPVKSLFTIGASHEDILNYRQQLEKGESGKAGSETRITSGTSAEAQKKAFTDISDNKDTDCFSLLRDKYKKLRNDLTETVTGQEQAVLKFIQGYNQGEMLDSVEKRNSPKSYFFFFGPPGTGKTLLANTAAKSLGIPYKIFNMSGYINYDALSELTGVSKKFQNFKEGELTGFVDKNPESVLIFDEFEKAHINIIRLFLQILGSGTLRDVCLEKDVDFTKTIIIFTSNAGRALYDASDVKPSSIPHKVLISALKNELPPEICSRLGTGNIIMFNHLGIRKLAQIAENGFEKVSANMREAYGVDISFSDKIPMLFLFQYGSGADARIARGQSEIFLKNEIYNLIERDSALAGISNIHFDVKWEDAAKEIQALFKNDTLSNVLVFCGSELKAYFDRTLERHKDKIKLHFAESIQEAKELLEKQISAVFIDPLYTQSAQADSDAGILDYSADGIKLFRELTDMKTDMPVFILENRDRHTFTDAEKNMFLQEGAFDVVYASGEGYESFSGKILQIVEELYMEAQHQSFSEKGFALDYKSESVKLKKSGRVDILFNELKRIAAIEADNRDMVLSAAEKPDVRFSDVIGAENAKDELSYFIQFLKNPKSYVLSGRKPPKGVLLFGPPGTGKTMLAKAMAGESEVAFLQTSASEFKNKYVGESEANIRRIFATAKKYAPAVIFIDEIDAIGKKRTGSELSIVEESMLNALLTEMDGFDPPNLKRPVFVLAATNFGINGQGGSVSAELDEALMRRFDNKIYVDLPNKDERESYINHIIGKNKDFYDISSATISNVADRTTGQSLAILQNVMDLAVRNAQKKGTVVNDSMLLTALEDYMYGERKEFSPEYYHGVAIHEAGHAYVLYKSGSKPSYITIESRGNFGGYMQHESNEDVAQYTKEDLLGRIRTALAGRASEIVFFGQENALNTGASSDLEKATDIAFRIIGRYGMTGNDSLAVLDKKDILASALAGEYVAEVNALLRQEMDNATRIIREGRDAVEKIAAELEKENHVTGARFMEIVEKL